MRTGLLSQTVRRVCTLAVSIVTLVVVGAPVGMTADAADPLADDLGFFFKVDDAKDCVFDHQRHRLYVTNEKQVIVLDTKDRNTIKSIELPGKVRACDIAPDMKHVGVAPFNGQFLYWISLDDLEVSQVRFKADATETGVFDLCVGSDGSILFSMVYLNSAGAASGWVKLRRFDPKTTAVTDVGRVRMDTVVSASADRQFAAVAEGNISSGPLKVFDFQEQQLRDVTSTNAFIYEIACSAEAKYFARPHGNGCDLYDAKGSRLGNLAGKPVICAAFHPKADRLFVMRHGETKIEEYALSSQKVAAEYPLEKALVISGNVNEHIVANLHSVGRDALIGHVSRVRSVHYKTFQSGRVRVSDDGESLFVVVPAGVYMFATKKPTSDETGPKIKVIEAR